MLIPLFLSMCMRAWLFLRGRILSVLHMRCNVKFVISDAGPKCSWSWPHLWKQPQRQEVNSCVRMFITSAIASSFINSTNSESFKQARLNQNDMYNGCRMAFDSGADTCCAGRHAYVEEFVEGKTVTAHGFSSSLKTLPNLPIANVCYAYDAPTGETFMLEVNNAIYLGSEMEDSLLCPNQCRVNGVEIDTRPPEFVPGSNTAGKMRAPTLDYDFSIDHHGPIPYIRVRRPRPDELLSCERVQLTPHDEWDPYGPSCSIDRAVATMTENIEDETSEMERVIRHDLCGVSSVLMGDHVSYFIGQVSTLRCDDIPSSDDAYVSQQAKLATRRKDQLSPESLARLWQCGLKTAERTLKATTHQCLRTTGVLTRRFRTDKAHMRYKRLASKQGTFYVDTLKAKVRSLRGFTCGNLYTNNLGFKKFFPMEFESETPHTLQSIIETVGIPPAIHSDNAKVFTEGDFRKKCRKYDIMSTSTEPMSPWQNRAEYGIGEVKSYGCKIMEQQQAPIRLWCFAYEYAADVLCLMATGRYQLEGRTPYEHVMHYTPDISEYITFKWYQWAYYWDQSEKEKKLCRWLGVAHNIGQSMCYYILTSNGQFLARSTVIPIPTEDLDTSLLKERQDMFTRRLHDCIGDHSKAIVNGDVIDDMNVYRDALYYDAMEDEITYPWDEELQDLPLHEDNDDALRDLDKYIGAQVLLPGPDGVEILCKVKSRKRDAQGVPVGQSHSNPILDSRIFNVEFPDGHVDEYATNIIAEAIYNNVDDDGYQSTLLQEIVAHRKGKDALDKADGFTENGKPVITTKGWDLKIAWSDGTYDWIPLSQIKNSNPLEVAEYAVTHELHREPAFNWWVQKTLRKRDRIIKNVTSKSHRKQKMKFGVVMPETVEEALRLDEENGNTLWADAIKKEYENVKVAFQLLNKDDRVPPGYKKITCHLVFEVKFDLRRKARYVAGGHLTEAPSSMTYASVVSRESVRIGFLLAALNDLDILAGDIQNAYLNAPTKEKVWFMAGAEWGDKAGRPVLIVRALYGLKGSGKAWRDHLADTLRNVLGFKSSLADPDVWYKPCTKSDGTKYYAYLMVYTDDILIIDVDPKVHMDKLQSVYTLKKGSIGPPSVYLGANIQKVPSRTGPDCWGMSAEQYVRDSVKNIKQRLKERGVEFNKKLSDVKYSPRQPFSNLKYRPELDTSTPCDDDQTTLYQNLIGILRWIIELGRIDINFEVSCLSQFLCYPRLGHLHQALHVFKYLDIHRESFLRFDPTRIDIDEPADGTQTFSHKANEMKSFYPDAEEALPTNAPEPRGEPVQINCFVDADHAGNPVTRRSHTGILIFLNMAPISWWSKRQNCVETSTYSSELVALKTATEQIIALRYKLRMFGVPIDGAAQVFCDNEAVYKNTSNPTSTLKKKHNSVAFHKIRSSVSCSILYVIKEESGSNLSDILTKSLPPDQRVYLRERIMYTTKVNGLSNN